jgi:hypothetical protein
MAASHRVGQGGFTPSAAQTPKMAAVPCGQCRWYPDVAASHPGVMEAVAEDQQGGLRIREGMPEGSPDGTIAVHCQPPDECIPVGWLRCRRVGK